MARLVEVGRFDNVIAAYRVVGVLAAAEIEAEVSDENAGAALPLVGAIGVRVVVAKEDADRAWAALAADRTARTAPRAPQPDDTEEAGGSASPVDPVAWATRTRALAFLGIVVPLFALAALVRAYLPPPEVAASPRASAVLRQARVGALLGLGLLGVIAALVGTGHLQAPWW
jgi:hypothetical protein